jgi:hypothetical protein
MKNIDSNMRFQRRGLFAAATLWAAFALAGCGGGGGGGGGGGYGRR